MNFDDLLKLAETKTPTSLSSEVASQQESLKAIMDPNADPKKVGKQGSAATMVLYVKEGLWTPQRAVEFWLDEKAEPLAKPAAAPHDRKVFDHDFVLAWLRTGEALTDDLTADGHPDPRALRKSLMDFMLPMAGWVQSDIIGKAVAQWDNEIQPKIEKAREVVAKPAITPADPTGSSADKTVSSAVTITIPGEQSPLASMRGILTDLDVEESAAIVYAVRRGHWTRDQAVEWWTRKRGIEGFPLQKIQHERKEPKVFNIDFARTWFDLSSAITDRMEADGIKTLDIQKMLTRRFLQPILKWVERETVLIAEGEWIEKNRARKNKAEVDHLVASATTHHNREYLPVILASLGTRGGYGLSWDGARKIWGNRANIGPAWFKEAAPGGNVDLNADMVTWMLRFASTLDNPKEFLRLDVFSELDLKEGIRNFVKSNWVYAMGPAATSNGVKRWGELMPEIARECPDALRWVANNLEGLVETGYEVPIATNLEKFLPHDPADLVAGPNFVKDFLATDIDCNEDLYETGAALLLSLHAREITMDAAVAWWRDAVLFSKGVLRLPEGTKAMHPQTFPLELAQTGRDLIKRLEAADAALSVEPLRMAMRKWVGPNLTEMVLNKTQGMPLGKITSIGGPMASEKSPLYDYGKGDSAAGAAERTRAIHESAAAIVLQMAEGKWDTTGATAAWLNVALSDKMLKVPDGVTQRDSKVFTRKVIETWINLGVIFEADELVPYEWIQTFGDAMRLWVDPDVLDDVRAKRFGPPATGGLTEDQALEAAAVLAVATHAANTRYARQQAVKIWSEDTIPRRQLGELRVKDHGYMVDLGRTWLEILKEMPEGWARTHLFRKSMELTLGSDVVEEAKEPPRGYVGERRDPTTADIDTAIAMACCVVHGGKKEKLPFEKARTILTTENRRTFYSADDDGERLTTLQDPKNRDIFNEDVVVTWMKLTHTSGISFTPVLHLLPWVETDVYQRGMDLYYRWFNAKGIHGSRRALSLSEKEKDQIEAEADDNLERGLAALRRPKRKVLEPLNIKTHGMIAVETLKDDAKEIALRTGVRRIRSLARARLSAWWAKATTPRGATESQDAWEARVRSVEATHGAFLGTDAGEAAMAMLLGFTWTAVSADVDGDQMRAFGDAVARELRVSAGSDILEGFLDEVVRPAVKSLGSAPEAAFSTNVRVVADTPVTEDSDGVMQAESAARTAHR